MNVYLDTSALVPLLVAEFSSARCRRLWDDADLVLCSAVGLVEATAAIARAARGGRLSPHQRATALALLDARWTDVVQIPVDPPRLQLAADVADRHALRGYDAVHCAASLSVAGNDLVAASGDQELLAAWRSEGLAVVDHRGMTDPTETQTRLDLYRYVGSAESTADYLAVMRLFSSGLLIDLSAAEIAARLAELPGSSRLDVDTVEDRCDALVRWGNLVRSVRDARVRTIADWQRARTRYQISKLGGRVHRQVEELLATTEGAREVARELLAGTADRLLLIRQLSTAEPADAERLAAEVTTLFSNQRVFLDSLADFYAYLATVLSRYDLAGEEYATFKGVLLDYVELLGSDVARHAPLVTERLAEVTPELPAVLTRLADLPGLSTSVAVERLPGRQERDWAEFTEWFAGARSGPERLRAAAEQALGQLLTNAKRMVSSAGTGLSRRDDLLRLAALFAAPDTDEETAHRLWAATFGAAPARHLALGPEDDDGRIPPSTSWWDAPPVDVPVSVREHGDRAARGRSARVPDPGLDRARLLAEAAAEAAALRAAAGELVAAGRLHGGRGVVGRVAAGRRARGRAVGGRLDRRVVGHRADRIGGVVDGGRRPGGLDSGRRSTPADAG